MLMSEKIKTARQAAGLSQQALGDVLCKTQGAVSQWEQGATKPELDIALPLSRALNVTLDWLLGEDDTELVQITSLRTKKTGVQLISQLSSALANDWISVPQQQLLSGLISEFVSTRPSTLKEDVGAS